MSIATDTLEMFGMELLDMEFFISISKRDPVFKWIMIGGATNHVVLAMYFTKQNRLLVGNNRGEFFEFKNQQWSNLIPENVNNLE